MIENDTRQVVLITGASGGIGREAVRAFAERGDIVIGEDRVAAADADGLAAFIELDVTDEAACTAAVARVVTEHGRIDVLVHAAGVLGTTPDPLQTSTAEFEQIMRINGSSSFTMAREVGNAMLATGTKGSILLISSVAAKEGRRDYLPYNASKVAVLHMVWSFAMILGPSGISVNAVAPGPVDTAMWAQKADDSGAAEAARAARAAELPMRRFARPQEVVQAILFLTDPANRYLTGVSLDVAGGAHLGMGS
jgi:NAD(P)-dependent dehydrogenase (short-subunit alcohol dehydrogenase family)